MSPDKKHHVHNIKTQKQTKPSQRAWICTQKLIWKKGNPQTELKTNKQINMRALIWFDTLSVSDQA